MRNMKLKLLQNDSVYRLFVCVFIFFQLKTLSALSLIYTRNIPLLYCIVLYCYHRYHKEEENIPPE